jgi:foldase protein PrsA
MLEYKKRLRTREDFKLKLIKKMLLLMVAGALVLQMVACDNKDKGQNNDVQYEITMDEYNLALERNMLQYQEQINGDENTIKKIEEVTLEQLILDKILTNEATLAKINVTDEEINTEYDRIISTYDETDNFNDYLTKNKLTEESYKLNIKNQFLINGFLRIKAEEIIKNNPTTSELKEFYNKNISTLKQVRASHILVDTEEAAKDVKKKLDEGAIFEELAMDISTCASSTSGGDLGYFTAKEMVAEFSNAAFAMEIGQISDPVKSEFGYHIIKLVEIKDTFEKADKESVIEQYRILAYNKMLTDYIDNTNIKMPEDLGKIRERLKGTE